MNIRLMIVNYADAGIAHGQTRSIAAVANITESLAADYQCLIISHQNKKWHNDMSNKITTSDDIKKVQIMISDGERHYLATTDDRLLIEHIVAKCKFLPLRTDALSEIAIGQIADIDTLKILNKNNTKEE